MVRRSTRLSNLQKTEENPTRSETEVEDWVLKQLEQVKQQRRENGKAQEQIDQTKAALVATPKSKIVDEDLGGDDIDVYLEKKEKRKKFLMTPSNSRINRLAQGTRSSSLKKTAPSTAEKQRKQSTRKLAFTGGGSSHGDFAPIPETPEKKQRTPRKTVKTPVKSKPTPQKTPSAKKTPKPKTPAKLTVNDLSNREQKTPMVKSKTPLKSIKSPAATKSQKTPAKENKENQFKPTIKSNSQRFNFTGKNDTQPAFTASGETVKFASVRERRLAYSKQIQARNRKLGVKNITKKKRTLGNTN